MTRGLGDRSSLLGGRAGSRRDVDLHPLDRQLARVETREVEQVRREPRESVDLRGHLRHEVAAFPLVEVFACHELEEAAEREERRAELVRCVRDELTAR